MKKLFAVLLSFFLITAPVQAQVQCNSDAGPTGKFKNQIVTMVTSSVGANIMLVCYNGGMQPSLWIFMGGSLTHVLAEIMAGKDIKKLIKVNEEELALLQKTNIAPGDLQISAIDKHIDDETQKKKFVEKRIKWLTAVKVMYGVAAIAAMVEFIREITSFGAYTSVAACGPHGGVVSAPTALAIVGAYTFQNYKAAGGDIIGLLQSLMFLFLPIHGSLVPSLYQQGLIRSITFGAATIFVNSVISDLNGVKDAIQCRIDKLNALKTAFLEQTKSDGGATETSGAGPGGQKDKYEAVKSGSGVKALAQGVPEKTCASSSSKGLEIGSKSCSKPLKLDRVKFDAKFTNPTLTDLSNQTIDTANALAAGDADRAELLAGSLASNAARVDKMNQDMQKLINDKLKEQGKKAIDFDAEIKKQVASTQASLLNAIDKNKASLGGKNLDEVGLGDDLKGTESAKEELVPTAVTETAGTPAPSNVDLSSLSSETAAPETQTANLDNSLGEYEINQNDIQKDPGVSIFKQLSNRYFLNYTKFFNRKEVTPPLQEAPKEEKK